VEHETYVCRSVERLLHDGEPQHQALTWLEDEVSRVNREHYQLGLEQISFKSAQNAQKKRPGRSQSSFQFLVSQALLQEDASSSLAHWRCRDEHLSRWSQFGSQRQFGSRTNLNATQTWFAEGEWDAYCLGWIARQQGKKSGDRLQYGGGCGTVPPKEQLEQLPRRVVVFYDRNGLNPHTGAAWG